VEIIDITIYEANDKIQRLENLRELRMNERDLVFERTQPKAAKLDREQVDGGLKREDRTLAYVIECEDPEYIKLCNQIDETEKAIFYYSEYVEAELKRIGEYEPLKAKIIELKDKKKMTWEEIVNIISGKYCERQCRRIYKDYCQKRYFE